MYNNFEQETKERVLEMTDRYEEGKDTKMGKDG